MATYELFLVLERFRRRFSRLVLALEPMSRLAPPPISTRAYFRADTGIVLLEVAYDRALLTADHLNHLIGLADQARVPLLDPSRLSDVDRAQFFGKYLPAYELTVQGYPDAEPTLVELARKLRLIASGHGTSVPVDADPSRDLRMRRLGSEGERAKPKPGAPLSPLSEFESGPVTDVDSSYTGRVPGAQTAQPRTTVRGTPMLGTPSMGKSFEVLFLRGNAWLPGRLRSLNSKGCYVACGATPRLRDVVQIVLRYAAKQVVVKGTVSSVTTPEDAQETGSSGFRVHFTDMTEELQQKLAELLRAAHAGGVSLTPPPARRAVRFPVQWPVRVTTTTGQLTVSALDMSTGGLFLATGKNLQDEDLAFVLPVDNGESPIRGQAQVCRRVDASMARARGLKLGYGVEITGLSAEDTRRYGKLLERVRRRAERRIVVAAAPERARAITKGLVAAGYSVTSGTNPRKLHKQWSKEPRPPDAAIIDSTLEKTDNASGASWLRRTWEGKHVPCVRTSTEPPEQTRALIDKLLRVDVN